MTIVVVFFRTSFSKTQSVASAVYVCGIHLADHETRHNRQVRIVVIVLLVVVVVVAAAAAAAAAVVVVVVVVVGVYMGL